jgi:hypothetical protein
LQSLEIAAVDQTRHLRLVETLAELRTRLRALMALINNRDLKDINNGVYAEKKQPEGLDRVFMVNDLGASFAPFRTT